MKKEEVKTRHFGGELIVHVDYKNNPIEGRVKRNFEKKHLKGYLRGDRYFSFGKDNHGEPNWFIVKEIWN